MGTRKADPIFHGAGERLGHLGRDRTYDALKNAIMAFQEQRFKEVQPTKFADCILSIKLSEDAMLMLQEVCTQYQVRLCDVVSDILRRIDQAERLQIM